MTPLCAGIKWRGITTGDCEHFLGVVKSQSFGPLLASMKVEGNVSSPILFSQNVRFLCGVQAFSLVKLGRLISMETLPKFVHCLRGALSHSYVHRYWSSKYRVQPHVKLEILFSVPLKCIARVRCPLGHPIPFTQRPHTVC